MFLKKSLHLFYKFGIIKKLSFQEGLHSSFKFNDNLFKLNVDNHHLVRYDY